MTLLVGRGYTNSTHHSLVGIDTITKDAQNTTETVTLDAIDPSSNPSFAELFTRHISDRKGVHFQIKMNEIRKV